MSSALSSKRHRKRVWKCSFSLFFLYIFFLSLFWFISPHLGGDGAGTTLRVRYLAGAGCGLVVELHGHFTDTMGQGMGGRDTGLPCCPWVPCHGAWRQRTNPAGPCSWIYPHVQKKSLKILDGSRLASPEPAQILRVRRFFMKDVFSVKIYQRIPKIKIHQKVPKNVQITHKQQLPSLVLLWSFLPNLLPSSWNLWE